MKKTIKVVMLPTEDKSGLQLAPDGSLRFTTNNTWESQHVYITVSQDVDPIKKGDWCITPIEEDIQYVIKAEGSNYNNLCRKIIVTTDPNLKLKVIDYNARKQQKYNPITEEFSGKIIYKHLPIPQPQQSFLKEFVSNPDGKWVVDYYADWDDLQYNEFGKYAPYKLKLNQDNTVNITSVKKKVYSKEEMYLSAANFIKQMSANVGNSDWHMKTTAKMIVDDWIKENL
jgi:hypothetical protein